MSGWAPAAIVLAALGAQTAWLARRFGATDELTERMGFQVMALVSIEQDDLDTVAGTLEELVTAISEIDTTVLAPADQTRLQSAVTGVTEAVNSKLPVDVPTGDGAV